MPVAALYRKDDNSSYQNVLNLSLPTAATAAIGVAITSLEADYSLTNVASKGTDIILQAYKHDSNVTLSVGINDFDLKIVQYTTDPLVDATNPIELSHAVRVHQWAPGLLQVNPSI